MSISSPSGSSAASIRSFTSSIPSFTTQDQDADILPAYTSLFPNQTTSTNPDTANLMRNRRDIPRYTTITLREIRFPSGCPCHPKTASEGREALRRERIALSRAARDRQQHAPPSIIPDTNDTSAKRAERTISHSSPTNRGRTTSSSSTSSTRTTHPATTTSSQCSTSLGLEVRAIDSRDPNRDLGLAYRTTQLKWWECMVTLPPKFVLLSGRDPDDSGPSTTTTSSDGSTGRTGSTASSGPTVCDHHNHHNHHEIDVPLARISRPLMNLPPNNRARIEIGLASTGYLSPVHSNEKARPVIATATQLRAQEWEIRQRGFRRCYEFYPSPSAFFSPSLATGEKAPAQPHPDPEQIFTWKGSRSILAQLPSSSLSPSASASYPSTATPPPTRQQKPKVHHGNLKLLSPFNDTVLAAWRSRRDAKVLGSLYVFEGAETVVSMDVLVATCLYVVVVERVLWTGFVGG